MFRRTTQIILLSLLLPYLYAQEITIIDEVALPPEDTEILYTSPSGVEVNLNPDGSIRSIMATGEAELIIGDRKDIRQALQKAEMRAKASIAKFLTESISSNQTLDEITQTITTADSDGSYVATRDTIEKTTESIRNSANEILKGVAVLLQDIDNENKFVLVTVGINEKTLQAAENIKNRISENKATSDKRPQSNQKPTHNREIRKNKMMDNF